ncbi:ATP-binding protein [Thalassobaculum sp.]|uniref:sensor histidine kinase n=1 Tax=Thalassobaculum sp. TaxID=2022740 RepID=UPI0032F0546F
MRLKWWVVLTVVGVQLAAAVLVVGATWHSISEGIEENARDSMRHLGRVASDRFHLFLAPAEEASRFLGRLIVDEAFDWADLEPLERYMAEPLRLHPTIDSLYFGSTAGDFLFVARDIGRGGYLVKEIRSIDGVRRVTYRRRDAELQLVETWSDPDDHFDPRVRPWFSAAVEADAAMWTAPYVFYTARETGVSAAVAIMTEDRRQWGAVGVDIRLSSFADRLTELSAGSEAAFIVDREGMIVAMPDHPERWPGLFGRAALSDRPVVASPDFQQLLATARLSRFGSIQTAGGGYWIDLQPLDAVSSPWLMAVSVPTDSLFSWARTMRDRIVFVTVGMALTAVVHTLVAWRFGVEGPIGLVAERLRRIAEGKADHRPVMAGPAEFRELDAAAWDAGRRIQDRESANDHLVEALREYEMAVQQAPVGIAILEPDGRILFANASYCRLVGPADPIGAVPHVLAGAVGPDMAARMALIRAGRTVREDATMRSAGDGAAMVLHCVLSPLSAAGLDGRAVLLVEDVTARKSIESDLVEARNAAERSDRAKSAFLAQMSHELRTPLNAIIGFSGVIRSEIFGPIGSTRYAEYIAHIDTSATHLKDLIERVLDVSRIEQGELRLSPREIEPEVLVREAQDMVQRAADDAGVTLELEVDRPGRIVADPSAIRQIVVNLVSNAVKFSPRGSSVTTSLRGIAGGGIEIRVADLGVGIPTKDLPHVFEPFWQGGSAWNAERAGVGLGLAIVRTLVERHGGTIEIDSAPGVGTRVLVQLPAQPPPEPEAREEA